ncbi:MAG: hypothetical protein H0V66_01520 [Bdellovibrionales bacterium]|nr:hypothetical protein [Bdellovibrionales bacterium]
MSISIRFLTLLILLFGSFLSYGQEKSYQYQLDGTYPATLPGFTTPRNIRFTITWNEKQQSIDGLYTDDFFTLRSPVNGTVGSQGRVFNIKLPRITQNVSNLSLISSADSVMVYMKDRTDMTISQTNILATPVVRPDYVEETASACDVGFGVLSGYCGVYRGTLNEVTDSNNQCNLPDYGFRLELSADARTNLYFYYSDTVIGIPSHNLGAFPEAPLSTTVTNSNRHCGVLVGTNFPTISCQVLTLNGTYGEVGEGRTFRGRYTITDEQSRNSCSYELVMEREKVY